MGGAEDGFDAGEGAATEAGGGFAVGHQLDGAGMEPEMDVGVLDEGLVVEASEVWLGAPAREVGFEVFVLGEGQAKILPDGCVAAFDLGQAFERESAFVKGCQGGLGKWPSAFGDAGAGGEVERVEFEDLASPTDGGAAFYADAAGVDAAMRKAGDLAVVEGLRGVFPGRAAAFEQENFFALSCRLYREGNACRSCAYDAEVRSKSGWGIS